MMTKIEFFEYILHGQLLIKEESLDILETLDIFTLTEKKNSDIKYYSINFRPNLKLYFKSKQKLYVKYYIKKLISSNIHSSPLIECLPNSSFLIYIMPSLNYNQGIIDVLELDTLRAYEDMLKVFNITLIDYLYETIYSKRSLND